MHKIILFGAGMYGMKALKKFGEYVSYFCDNDEKKQGTYINGVYVIDFSEMEKLYKSGEYKIIITPCSYSKLIIQLEQANIFDYILFEPELMERKNVIDSNSGKTENEEYEEIHSIVYKYTEQSQNYDLPVDVKNFRTVASDLLEEYSKLTKKYNSNSILTITGFNSEGRFYGNADNLMRYAGIDVSERMYFPQVSHNAVIYDPSAEFIYRHAVIFQGTYFKDKIHKRFPYVPVFSVGSFINYAIPVYSEEKIKELKQKNGRTALVFMPHSIENIRRIYDKKDFIDLVIKKYENSFDTFLLSVYWTELNDPICEYAESQGIKLVSAGFRFDSKFNDRLITMFELSDAVICGDLGSFIPYSLTLGKPIARVVSIDDVSKLFPDYKKNFDELFNDEFRLTDEQIEWTDPLCGTRLHRSPEYIRKIYEISHDVMDKCNGVMLDYPGAVSAVCSDYYRYGNIEKYLMLKDAVGNFFV